MIEYNQQTLQDLKTLMDYFDAKSYGGIDARNAAAVANMAQARGIQKQMAQRPSSNVSAQRCSYEVEVEEVVNQILVVLKAFQVVVFLHLIGGAALQWLK